MKKYDNTMLKTANDWAKMSSCERRKVGAIISRESRIVSNGYNGTVSKSDNCCEEKCTQCNGKGCEKCNGKGIISKNTVVHAEANAILFAAKEGISLNGCTIYITLSPCVECAKMIIQSGIKRVYYENKYKDLNGVKFLKDNNIHIEELKLK
jgi:dCMP deaminase